MSQNTSSAVMPQRSEPHNSLNLLRPMWGSGKFNRHGEGLETSPAPNQNGSRKDHVMADKALHLASAGRQDFQENWEPIDGWTGYEVSDQGRVRSWKQRGKKRGQWIVDRSREPRILRHDIRNGYPSVVLVSVESGRKWESIHRLVLSAFVGPMPPSIHGAHGDGDKQNNYIRNLRWATAASNNADKVRHGTRQNGESARSAKLTWADAALIRERRSAGALVRDVAKDFGVCRNTITNITTGRTWVAENGAK